jgi:hypothetical protein
MLYNPWTLAIEPVRKKLGEQLAQLAEDSSRAESHGTGQHGDDNLSARDSRATNTAS